MSGTAESDRHLAVFENHGNRSFASRDRQHGGEGLGIVFDVLVVDRHTSTAKVDTGRLGVGSALLSVDSGRHAWASSPAGYPSTWTPDFPSLGTRKLFQRCPGFTSSAGAAWGPPI